MYCLEYEKEFKTCNVPVQLEYECDIKGLLPDDDIFHYKGV